MLTIRSRTMSVDIPACTESDDMSEKSTFMDSENNFSKNLTDISHAVTKESNTTTLKTKVSLIVRSQSNVSVL